MLLTYRGSRGRNRVSPERRESDWLDATDLWSDRSSQINEGDLERYARFAPDLYLEHVDEGDCVAVEHLLARPDRIIKLAIAANRIANHRAHAARYDNHVLHGSVANSAMNIGEWRQLGERNFVAVMANRFGMIWRGERWVHREQVWRCVEAWEYCRPITVNDHYPSDAPMIELLQEAGYEVYPGVTPRNNRVWLACQMTTADHLLKHFGKRFPGVFFLFQLDRILREPWIDINASDQARVSKRVKYWGKVLTAFFIGWLAFQVAVKLAIHSMH